MLFLSGYVTKIEHNSETFSLWHMSALVGKERFEKYLYIESYIIRLLE